MSAAVGLPPGHGGVDFSSPYRSPSPQPVFSPSFLQFDELAEGPLKIRLLDRFEQVNLGDPSPKVATAPPPELPGGTPTTPTTAPRSLNKEPSEGSPNRPANPAADAKLSKSRKSILRIPLKGLWGNESEKGKGGVSAGSIENEVGASPRAQPKKKQEWKSVVDSSSGKVYYYHSATKETRWVKPEGFDEEEFSGREKKKSPTKEGVWKSASDKEGRTYYYHTGRKEMSWDKPQEDDNEEPSSDVSNLPEKGTSGRWKSVVDCSSGKVYYYHSATKETRWVKPEGFDEQEPSREKKTTPLKKGGWKSASDKEGRAYYYHTGRKEMSWVKPDDFDEDREDKSPPPSPPRLISLTRPNSHPRTTETVTGGGGLRCSSFDSCDTFRLIMREEEEAAAERRLLRQLRQQRANKFLAEERAQRRAEEEEACRIRAEELKVQRRFEGEKGARTLAEERADKDGNLDVKQGVPMTRNKSPREMEEIWARTNGWRR